MKIFAMSILFVLALIEYFLALFRKISVGRYKNGNVLTAGRFMIR